MADFTEVADRVWVARYEWFDVNVTAVGGDRGLVVVDTHGSTAAATTPRARSSRSNTSSSRPMRSTKSCQRPECS